MGHFGRWRNILWLLVIIQFLLHCYSNTVSARHLFRRNSNVTCKICEPGFGVIVPCNVTHDTLCSPCGPGTFQPTLTLSLACRECSKCGEDFYTRTPCIPKQDATCSSCSGKSAGFGNENFRKKCEKTTTTTTPVVTTTTTPVVTTKIALQTLPQKVPTDFWVPTETSSGDVNIPGSGDIGLEQETEDPTPEFIAPTDEGFLPVEPSRRPPKQTIKTEEPKVIESRGEEEEETTEEPQVGALQLDRGGFDFPVFIAAVVCAIVFFILGMLVNTCIRRRKYTSPKKSEIPYAVDDPRTTMMQMTPLTTSPDNPYDEDDTLTPIYKGKRY